VGDFVENEMSGNGILILAVDEVYKGEFKNNKIHGKWWKSNLVFQSLNLIN